MKSSWSFTEIQKQLVKLKSKTKINFLTRLELFDSLMPSLEYVYAIRPRREPIVFSFFFSYTKRGSTRVPHKYAPLSRRPPLRVIAAAKRCTHKSSRNDHKGGGGGRVPDVSASSSSPPSPPPSSSCTRVRNTAARHAQATRGRKGGEVERGGLGPKRRRAIAPSGDENTENRLEKAT